MSTRFVCLHRNRGKYSARHMKHIHTQLPAAFNIHSGFSSPHAARKKANQLQYVHSLTILLVELLSIFTPGGEDLEAFLVLYTKPLSKAADWLRTSTHGAYTRPPRHMLLTATGYALNVAVISSLIILRSSYAVAGYFSTKCSRRSRPQRSKCRLLSTFGKAGGKRACPCAWKMEQKGASNGLNPHRRG